ncbi:hypothetical protein MKW94_014686 [Papaver nudicaule]|uniref:N-acetyltransferase domain-containing protein n=1 Tax=Papaver nudicaule TaxID=74823 RepID=A0AA41S7A9_PAPNU|nr:hypothetical protein [Papaver nudicaule]
MLMSMNVFQQTSTPKLLNFPSVSCHARRRIPPNKPAFLVSFPATTMEFNPKFLDIRSCHGFSHSSCKPVLGSPATIKFSTVVLFALPRDNNEEFSSDDEEEPKIHEHEEDCTSVSSDDVHEEQSKKVEVREATNEVEYWASAKLKTEGFFEDRLHERDLGSFEKKQIAEKFFNVISERYKARTIQKFMCIIAVRKEGEDVLNGMRKNVIGTLDLRIQYLLRGETYPEELVTAKMIKTFKQRGPRKCGIISNVTVAKSARQQGVASRMLKFAMKSAKDNGAKQVFLHVRRDNKPALALYKKLGFTILEDVTTPHLEEHNLYWCSINL